MKITLDNELIQLNLQQTCQHLSMLYDMMKDTHLQLEFKGGLIVDFSKKSISRIALSAVLVPVLLPIMKGLYTSKNIEIPEHMKHTDYIDYIVQCVLHYVSSVEKEYQLYVKTDKDATSGIKTVTAVSPHAPDDSKSRRATTEAPLKIAG